MENSDSPHDHKIDDGMLKKLVVPTFRVKLHSDGWAEAIGVAAIGKYHKQLIKDPEVDADLLAKLWEVYKKLQ